MAFLGDIDRKLSQLGQGALKKTRDVSDSVKISGAVREEENKQMECFRQIGEYYYQNYFQQARGELQVLCNTVRESQMLVQQYQEQLRLLKGVNYCPNCYAEVPINSVFCSRCGARVIQPQAAAGMAAQGMSCPYCGAATAPGQLFCTNCGGKIQAEPQPEPVVVRKCAHCGAELAEEQIYCTRCGNKYEGPAAVQEEQVPQQSYMEASYNVTPQGDIQLEAAAAPQESVQPEAFVLQESIRPEAAAAPQEYGSQEASVSQADETGEVLAQETAEAKAAEPQETEIPSAVSETASVCPSCGKELKAGQNFCTNCGTKL